ncbi:unnamed protein product [Pocillopora meandrina]|uniref:Uncharacterized protein n=1 Tax=Pocillopora meandrina TaxID=46732 RepID=A0AAU9VTL8_9CNID|nr:unnamed protein product [Pocillopora meandrina]
MVHHFNAGVINSGLNIKNMVQISMDGPNVNWKFYDKIKVNLSEEFHTTPINVGSCGIHTVHNSFKAGVVTTEWNVSSILSSLYYHFKDSPARREDFVKVTGSSQLALKFVSHRWLENVVVSERALNIWKSIELYVKAVKEKRIPNPGNKSFQVIKEAVDDKLILAKLQYFKCIASQLQLFLTNYQTDKPMVCFLATDLSTVLRDLMRRFIKDDVLSKATKVEKLMLVDVEDKSNHKSYKKIDVGFCTENALKDACAKAQKEGSSISDKQLMAFRLECKSFLIAILKKLVLKCPLSYSLVRNMVALDPRDMATNPNSCSEKFKKIQTVLVNSNKVRDENCDNVLQQYSNFLDRVPVIGSDIFSSFNPNVHRVDEFCSTYMSGENYVALFDIVKILLVLSHGQASAERGFSVNKEIEVENLHEYSLVAQRIICDHLRAVGGVLNVPITKKLLAAAASSRQKYEKHLQDQRDKKKTHEEQRKRKHALDEIEELKEKKKRMKLDVDSLLKSADDLSFKAEATGQLTFVTKSNALRKAAKEKTLQLQEVEDKLNGKLEALKGC